MADISREILAVPVNLRSPFRSNSCRSSSSALLVNPEERTVSRVWIARFDPPEKGQAAAVVQDAEAYQHLLDLAAEANAGEGIRQGLEDVKNRRTRPARALFNELRGANGVAR